jgi:hypothetical protein
MMAVADYNKADVAGLGHAIAELINAVRGDGVGADDLDELIGVLTSAAQSVNEMKDVPEAAVEHVLGAAADKLGDFALEKALTAPEA